MGKAHNRPRINDWSLAGGAIGFGLKVVFNAHSGLNWGSLEGRGV